MIVIDTDEFYQTVISWIKLHNAEERVSTYQNNSYSGSSIDEQILARVLFPEEAL